VQELRERATEQPTLFFLWYFPLWLRQPMPEMAPHVRFCCKPRRIGFFGECGANIRAGREEIKIVKMEEWWPVRLF